MNYSRFVFRSSAGYDVYTCGCGCDGLVKVPLDVSTPDLERFRLEPSWYLSGHEPTSLVDSDYTRPRYTGEKISTSSPTPPTHPSPWWKSIAGLEDQWAETTPTQPYAFDDIPSDEEK